MRINGFARALALCVAGLLGACVEEERPAWGAGVYPPAAQTAANPFDQFDPPQPVYVDQDQIAQLEARHARDAALYEQRRANEIALRQARALEERNVLLHTQEGAREEHRDDYEESGE